jgi:hypothetical protein
MDLMTDASDDLSLFDQLQKLIGNAGRIRSEPFQRFADELSRKLLYLRPSVGGISAISCCEDTPQRGFKVSGQNLERKLETRLLPPGRDTPEKHLQSWLNQQAMKSGGRLKLLDDLLDGQYWFVSDEIALKSYSEKLVADMLTVRVDSGMASLVNVELKSLRSMETFEQVKSFRRALEEPSLQESWRKFAEIMIGRSFQWHPSHETHGIVVWPAPKILTDKRPRKALADTKRKKYERMDLIGYRCVPEIEKIPGGSRRAEPDRQYSFEIEKLA